MSIYVGLSAKIRLRCHRYLLVPIVHALVVVHSYIKLACTTSYRPSYCSAYCRKRVHRLASLSFVSLQTPSFARLSTRTSMMCENHKLAQYFFCARYKWSYIYIACTQPGKCTLLCMVLCMSFPVNVLTPMTRRGSLLPFATSTNKLGNLNARTGCSCFHILHVAKATWQQCSKTIRAVNFCRFPGPLNWAITGMNQKASLAVLLFVVPLFIKPN
jgi:hypothetical protein